MRMEKSYTSICFLKYPAGLAWAGILSMAIFRLPMAFRKDVQFFKLMGCGKSGSFDFHPDWRQWAILAVHSNLLMEGKGNVLASIYGNWISGWIKIFRCKTRHFVLEPMEGHGKWNGKEPFLYTKDSNHPNDKIAILTRATIRSGRLRAFWKNASVFNHQMAGKVGLEFSIGFGEMPFKKQATFSVWENLESMKSFAYRSADHKEVIQRTRVERWYSEEMFVRFRVII